MSKKCLGCPTDISHMVGQARYCSVKCRFWSQRKNKSRNCLECGTDLFKLRDKEKFCSDECVKKHRDKLNLLAIASDIKKQKPCKFCINSDHEGFCCTKHAREYDNVMSPINEALNR